MTKGTKEITNN